MFSTWSNSQNKVPPTAGRDDPFGWVSGDLPVNSPGRIWQAIAPQQQVRRKRRQGQAGRGGGRGAMGYWTIASIGRLEIVPPGRSGPGSSSGSGRGSRGGSDILSPDEDEEASAVEAWGGEEEEEEGDWTIPSAGP